MMSREVLITGVIQNILNDTDLEHLTVKDLRNFVINLQNVEEEDEEEPPQIATKYII